MQLSQSELDALEWLKREGNGSLVSVIPDRNERDVFGRTTPGMGVYRKLEKKGLIYFTEEEPIELEDGSMFEFTPSVYLEE